MCIQKLEFFMFKNIITSLIDQPILTSFFVSDLLVLLFHRPPIIASLLMFGALLAMTMYFGQKLALFKL